LKEEMDEKEIQEKKARYFLGEKQEVHITVRSGMFFNGFITYVGADFLLIDDRKLGEMPLFFEEIRDIERYEVRS
jgi:hypothetical protein